MIKMTFDLHTHSGYSDGKNTMEENIVSAIEKGLVKIGITDHAYRHTAYGVKRHALDGYLKNAMDLKKAYRKEIEVLVGLEFDLIDLDGHIDIPSGYEDAFDIKLLGVHKATRYSDFKSFSYLLAAQTSNQIRYSKKVMEANTQAFVAAVAQYDIDVLVHPNYITKVDMGKVAKACAAKGTLLEINARHEDMTKADMTAVLATDVKFVLGSDAHKAAHIGRHGYVERFIKDHGLNITRIVNAKSI